MEFKTPVEIRVTPGAEPKVFESFDRLSAWAEQQIVAWERFGRALQAHGPEYMIPGPIYRVLLTQKTEWRLIKEGRIHAHFSKDIPEHKQFEREINQAFARHALLALEQPLVDRALSLAPIDPQAAGMVLVIASDQVADILENADDKVKTYAYFGRAVAYLSTTTAYDTALSDHLFAVEEIANGVRKNEKDRADMRGKFDQELSAFVVNSGQRVADFDQKTLDALSLAKQRLEAIETDWLKLRETYDRMLKLSEPRKYWSEKLDQHERIFKRWRLAFFMVVASSVFVLFGATYLLISQGEQMSKGVGSYEWVLPAMLLGVPAFMMLWLLRICGRQWQDHLSRVEDARERVVMVETFLALSRDEASPASIADAAQLGVVLGSIFRAGPGFAADDSPPAGILEILLSKVSAKN